MSSVTDSRVVKDIAFMSSVGAPPLLEVSAREPWAVVKDRRAGVQDRLVRRVTPGQASPRPAAARSTHCPQQIEHGPVPGVRQAVEATPKSQKPKSAGQSRQRRPRWLCSMN